MTTHRRQTIGRGDVIATLEDAVAHGQTVLIHGPPGIGKSTVLAELRRRVERSGRPCALSARTSALKDVTEALGDAYPDGAGVGWSAAQRRSGLRRAIEERPGALLLDGLCGATGAIKTYLRTLRGAGLGVVLATDVAHPRDHERARARGLAFREIALEPLGARAIERVFDNSISNAAALHPIADEDRRALVRLARGRPGAAIWFATAALEARYWREGRLKLDVLAADELISSRTRGIA